MKRIRSAAGLAAELLGLAAPAILVYMLGVYTHSLVVLGLMIFAMPPSLLGTIATIGAALEGLNTSFAHHVLIGAALPFASWLAIIISLFFTSDSESGVYLYAIGAVLAFVVYVVEVKPITGRRVTRRCDGADDETVRRMHESTEVGAAILNRPTALHDPEQPLSRQPARRSAPWHAEPAARLNAWYVRRTQESASYVQAFEWITLEL